VLRESVEASCFFCSFLGGEFLTVALEALG
jgi:hypothetical protein